MIKSTQSEQDAPETDRTDKIDRTDRAEKWQVGPEQRDLTKDEVDV